MKLSIALLIPLLLPGGEITRPEVSEQVSPLQVVTVKASDGGKSVMILRKPPGKGPFPAVVILHGGLNVQTEKQLSHAVRTSPTHVRLLAAGYVIAAPTFRNRDLDPQEPGTLLDVLAAIDYVKAMPEVDPESVALAGGSGGASLAIEAAGQREVAAALLGEPASILFMGMFTKQSPHKGERFSPSDTNDMCLNPEKYLTPEVRALVERKISQISCPLLIGHGDVHPLKVLNSRVLFPALALAGKRVEWLTFPGGPHGFYFGSGRPESALRFFEAGRVFLERNVKTKPRPVDSALISTVAVGRK